jgi:hypothetical protein
MVRNRTIALNALWFCHVAGNPIGTRLYFNIRRTNVSPDRSVTSYHMYCSSSTVRYFLRYRTVRIISRNIFLRTVPVSYALLFCLGTGTVRIHYSSNDKPWFATWHAHRGSVPVVLKELRYGCAPYKVSLRYVTCTIHRTVRYRTLPYTIPYQNRTVRYQTEPGTVQVRYRYVIHIE